MTRTVERRFISIAEAADYLGVHTRTIRRHISSGSIAGYRIGHLIRVDLDEINTRLIHQIPSGGKDVA